ncbi:extensin-like [Pistacia vera]|uniref:extensin-like n=1 Tax=Pistacia vera TaxID=55513 RepID=UPI001263A179|nr:extensin-like [Pistacia vera]
MSKQISKPVLSHSSSFFSPINSSSSSSSTTLLRIDLKDRVESLYELSYIPEGDSTPLDNLLIPSPYKKPSQPGTTKLRTLVKPPKYHTKEYVYSSRFDQHGNPGLNPYYQKALKQISHSQTTTFAAAPCAMYTSSPGPSLTMVPPSLTSLEAFPHLTPFTTDHTSHSWKIKDPSHIDPLGNSKKPSPAKTVLNWQSQNAEQEIKFLKNQLYLIEHTPPPPPIQAPSSSLWSLPPVGPFSVFHNPKVTQRLQSSPLFSQQQHSYPSVFSQLSKPTQPWKSPPTPTAPAPHMSSPLPPPSAQPPSASPLKPSKSSDTPSSSYPPPPSQFMMSSSPSSNPITEFLTHHTATEHTPISDLPIHYATLGASSDADDSDTFSESSSTDSDALVIFMNQFHETPPDPDPDPDPEPNVEEPPVFMDTPLPPTGPPSVYNQAYYVPPSSGPWFNLDPHHPSKWREKIHEIYTWGQTELIKPNATLLRVIEAIVARFMGILRQWWYNLG